MRVGAHDLVGSCSPGRCCAQRGALPFLIISALNWQPGPPLLLQVPLEGKGTREWTVRSTACRLPRAGWGGCNGHDDDADDDDVVIPSEEAVDEEADSALA